MYMYTCMHIYIYIMFHVPPPTTVTPILSFWIRLNAKVKFYIHLNRSLNMKKWW